MQNAKVNHAMSFLKGMALNYFEPFLDTLDNKPAWLKDYKLFIKELLINFSPYDALAEAEVELDTLIMKDNHKATRFFVNFFWLSTLCDYNDRALLRKVYSMLPKRVKDQMTHFNSPSTLQELRDLVLKIDQRYWECNAEIAHENSPTPQMDSKPRNKSPTPEATSDTSVLRTRKSPSNQCKRNQT